MKVLVTGASGFIGRALCTLLKAGGHEIVPVVRQTGGLAHEFVIEHADDSTDWRNALSGCDTVVHLAARTHVMHDSKADSLSAYRAVNVRLTLALAQQASAAGIRRFVFISSVKVNGEATSPDRAFTERDAPAPQDAYGQSKLEAEHGLMAIAQETGLEMVIIRPPLVYGPGVKGNFSSLVRWVRKGMPLPLGAVNNRRSMIASDNLVDFIALCANRENSPQAANEVFLISDEENVSTTELLRRVARAYGVKARLLPVPAGWLRRGACWLGKKAAADRLLGSLEVDSTKARELLGWQPVITMDEQLRKMANDAASA